MCRWEEILGECKSMKFDQSERYLPEVDRDTYGRLDLEVENAEKTE